MLAVEAPEVEVAQAAMPLNRAKESVPWLLFVPLIFFAVRGAFSFQSSGDATGSFTPGVVQVREPGMLGSVIIPALVYAIVLWFVRSRWQQVFFLAKQFKIMTFLAVLAVISVAWSQNPAHSIVVGACFCLDTLFAFYLLSRFETEELMLLLDKLLVIVVISSLFMIAFLPKYGLSQLDVRNPDAWAGIFSSRGGVARVLLYLMATSLLLWRKNVTIGRSIILLLGLLIVYKSHVVTTDLLLMMFLGFLFVQFLNRRLGPRSSFALLALVIGGILFLSVVAAFFLPAILQALGRDPTLTGRTLIWGVLVDSVIKRPFLGYGYYAFWQGLKGESGIAIHKLNWTFGYAHNGYLEVSLQFGLLGLGVFLASLLRAIRNCWICLRLDRTSASDWFIGIIMLVVFTNVDDCTILWPRDLLSILYIVVYCSVAMRARGLQRNRYLGAGAYV